MIYRVPYERGAIRTGDDRAETDTSEEPTLIVPADITREWRRRLEEQRQRKQPKRSDHEAA